MAGDRRDAGRRDADLDPCYVLSVTGSAADSGLVMGMIMLAGGLGPVLGRLSDRYRVHRAVLVLGCLGMALALVVYGLSAEREAILIADALFLGAAGTAVSTVAPVFVISAGLSPDLEARRLTALNVCQPIGQTGLAAVLAVAAAAGLSFSGRFYLAAGILFVLTVVVWLTSAGPARQIRASRAAPDPSSTPSTPRARKTLAPDFTRFLAIVFLTSVAFVGVVNQISNILPKVYGFSESQTATVVSVAGFAAIVFFFVAGRTLRRTNAVRTAARQPE